MSDLLPCRVCGDVPNRYPLTTQDGVDLWCIVHHCRDKMRATSDDAAAEWNAANAAPDPALLALARFGALMCRDAQWPDDDPVGYQDHCEQIDLSAPEVRRLMDEAGLRVDRDGTPEPGVRAAIARLLAPDGPDGAGEVADA